MALGDPAFGPTHDALKAALRAVTIRADYDRSILVELENRYEAVGQDLLEAIEMYRRRTCACGWEDGHVSRCPDCGEDMP